MSKAWKERLFFILFFLAMGAGLTFLVLSFVDSGSDNRYLGIGLCCIAVGNLMNLYRMRKRNRENQGKTDQKE